MYDRFLVDKIYNLIITLLVDKIYDVIVTFLVGSIFCAGMSLLVTSPFLIKWAWRRYVKGIDSAGNPV
jgi:hypothetical protein